MSSDEAHPALVQIGGGDDIDRPIAHQRGLRSPLRTLGGLKAVYLKAAPDWIISPKKIANEIRHLRGHHRLTIYERHRRFNNGDHTCSHRDELVSLCKRLINFLGT